MKLASKVLWLAACVGMAVGSSNIVRQQDDTASSARTLQPPNMFASSHTLLQRQSTLSPAPSHMFASSHTLARRKVTASPVLSTSISLVETVASGMTAVVPTNIIITLTPSNNLNPTSTRSVGDILQDAAITTVTSILGLTSATASTTRMSSMPTVAVTLTSTVEDVVIVTENFPSASSIFQDPQSQIQGPSISFVPIASVTSNTAPPSTPTPSIVPSTGGYTYSGCFLEGLDARALGDAFFPSDSNTIGRCTAACFPNKYAGAEYGRECWCGNELKNATNANNADFCNMPCAGDPQELCGGIVALNVYVRAGEESSSLVPVSGSSSRPSRTLSSVSTASTSHIITSPTSSSAAASSGPASMSSFTSSNTSSANSDSQVSTAFSVSSQATTSISSSKSTRFVTSSHAVPVSIIVDNGSTTTTSFRTRTESSTMSSIVITSSSTSFILPSPSRKSPSPMFPTTKDRLTSSTTLKPAAPSNAINTLDETATNLQTVSQRPLYTALPVYTIIDSVQSESIKTNTDSTATSAFPFAAPSFTDIIPEISPIPPLAASSTKTTASSATTIVTQAAPTQSGKTPPSFSTPKPTTSLRTSPKSTAYTYGTGTSTSTHPSQTIITVTSLLTPTTILPVAGTPEAYGAEWNAPIFLAGFWALILLI